MTIGNRHHSTFAGCLIFAARCLVVGLGAAGWAAGNASELLERDVHREHGYVPMTDGTRLAVVVWLPHKDGRFPVLFRFSAYADNAIPFESARPFLEAGYALVGANIRGSGCSEGDSFAPFSADEGPDGAELVDWAGIQPWSTGHVGMIGNSYQGDVQWLVGAQRPRHLRALAASGSSASDYRDWLMVGGMFHHYAVGEWGLVAQERLSRAGVEKRIGDWGDKECERIVAKRKPGSWYYQVLRHPLQDEWWETDGLSKEHAAKDIRVPTLLSAGLQDEFTNPATGGRGFAHLLTGVQHKRLVYSNGGHAAHALAPVFGETMRWMDRWVKGVDNGVDREPPVRIFWETQFPEGDYSRAVPGWTSDHATWPVPGLERTTLFLGRDASLQWEQTSTKGDPGPRSYLYPTGSELVGSNEQFAVQAKPAGSLHYRTAPVTADMTMIGNPELVLYFSSDNADTDFMVTLKDIDRRGDTLYLTRGFLRASLRQIDPARAWPDEVNQSYRNVEKLEPGIVHEARFSLWTMAHVLRRGHRLELSILAPSAIPSPVLGATPVGGPSINSIHHSTKFPSRLVLPLLPGKEAGAPAPACGVLWNQPCRKAPASSENWQGGLPY